MDIPSDWSPVSLETDEGCPAHSASEYRDDGEQGFQSPGDDRGDQPSDRGLAEKGGTHPSMVEQARKMGLCSDYLAAHPYTSPYFPTPPETTLDDLEDPPGVLSVGLSTVLSALGGGGITGDKWIVDRESAALIASSFDFGKEDHTFTLISNLTTHYKCLKADLPILGCDHDLDLRLVMRRNRFKHDGRGSVEFSLEVERDESVMWPSELLDLPDQMTRTISAEKLDVEQATIDYVREILAPPSPHEDWATENLLLSERVRARPIFLVAKAD